MRGLEAGEEFVSRTGGVGELDLPEPHFKQFWKEMLEEVSCIHPDTTQIPRSGPENLISETINLLEDLSKHFFATLETTAPDHRHDGAFGLAIYAGTFLLNSASGYVHARPEGRVVLRTIAEVPSLPTSLRHRPPLELL